MTIDSVTKLIVCVLVGLVATYLGSVHILDGQTVATLLAAILGYVFGNGHGVLSAQRNNKEGKNS